jgi:hypothetical protein
MAARFPRPREACSQVAGGEGDSPLSEGGLFEGGAGQAPPRRATVKKLRNTL